MLILINSGFLAFVDPNDSSNDLQSKLDVAFLVIYSIEMFLKIFALGFVLRKGSYLRDAWNVLDFIIVVSGYLSYLPNTRSVNLKGLRALRVLRPLRTISSIKPLRRIITSLVKAIPLFCDVILILLLLFLVFAIAGLQLLPGLLKRRCFLPETGIPYLDSSGNPMLCGFVTCPEGYACGKMTANPDFDVTNFDTIANALIMVFQIVTMEGWSSVMINYEMTYTPVIVIYFVFLVFLGGFFLLNLFLAVIKAVFTTSHRRKQPKILTFEDKLQQLVEKKKESIVNLLKAHRKGLLDYDVVQILHTGDLRKYDEKFLEQKRKDRRKSRKKTDFAKIYSRMRTDAARSIPVKRLNPLKLLTKLSEDAPGSLRPSLEKDAKVHYYNRPSNLSSYANRLSYPNRSSVPNRSSYANRASYTNPKPEAPAIVHKEDGVSLTGDSQMKLVTTNSQVTQMTTIVEMNNLTDRSEAVQRHSLLKSGNPRHVREASNVSELNASETKT